MNNADTPAGADEIREQLPRLAAATGAPAPGDGRSLPSIAINQPFAPLCRAVGQCQRNTPLFRKGENFVTVDAATGEELPITASVWRSWHQQFFTFHEGDGDKRRTVDCPKDKAQVILDSHELRADVRELRAVHQLRLPVWRGEGADRTLDLLPAGYDAATKTFTVPLLDYPLDWTIEQAHQWLFETFGTFPFFEDGGLFAKRSFGALVVAMLGVYGVNLLPEGAVRPLVLVDGNQVKLGKSMLVRMILCPVHGRVGEGSKPKSDEELRKILDATAIAGKPYLFIDDLHNLASNDLNHFTSSATHEPRAMHTLKLPICPNVWQVFGSGKDIKLSDDLERRIVPIDLFRSDEWRERRIKNPWTTPRVLLPSYRAPACAAEWAIIRHWVAKGMPICDGAWLESFDDYAAIFGSMGITAGIASAFSRRENIRGGNDSMRALVVAICALAATRNKGDALSTGEIIEYLTNEGTLDVVVPTAKNELGQKQKLGWKLAPLRGNAYTDTRGRRFEFGKKDDAPGARYTLHFLDADATA